MPPPHFTPIKICFNGEIHRFTWDIEAHGYSALRTRFCETFPQLANDAFLIQYTDLQGDVVTISSDGEYYHACDEFRLVDGTCKLMRFTAVARGKTAAFQEHVADPILKAIEKLVETLNAAMEQVKHEDWKARAQSGVEYTNEALHGAAKEARESLDTVCESIREIPFDQMLKDTTDGIKVAAEGISVFAQEVVAEMQKEKLVQDATERLKTAAETVAEFAKDAVDELKNIQLPHGAMPFVPVPFVATPAASVVPVAPVAPVAPVSPVEQQATEVVAAEVVTDAPVSGSADSDWEQIAAHVAVVEEEATAAVEAEIVEMRAKEQKWAAQVAMIRDIFPGMDTRVAIERLEQADGDVQVVLNALLEAM